MTWFTCAVWHELHAEFMQSVGEEREAAQVALSGHITTCPACKAEWERMKAEARKARIEE